MQSFSSSKAGVLFALLILILCPAALQAQAPQEPQPAASRFYSVQEHLDMGGTFYLYADVQDLLRHLVERQGQARLGGASPMAAAQLQVVSSVIEALGIYGVHDIGLSTKPDTMEMYVNRGVLTAPEGRKGLLALFGDRPHVFDILQMAPADTALFSSNDCDFEGLLALVRQLVVDVAGPGMEQQMQAKMDETSRELGVPVEQLLASLGLQFGFIMRFDETTPLELPLPNGQSVSIPSPQGVLVAETSEGLLFELLKSQIAKKMEWQDISLPGYTQALTLGEQPLGPWNPEPVIAQDGRFFYIASHSGLLRKLKSQATGASSLADTATFRNLSQGMPSEGNHLSFMSIQTIQHLRTVLHALAMQQEQKVNAMSQVYLQMLNSKEKGFYSIVWNKQDGIYMASRSEERGQQFSMILTGAGVAPAAIVAAIAIPNFVEARSRAQVSRAKADMRSLATALESYSIDTNAYPASTLDPERSVYGAAAAPGGAMAGIPGLERPRAGLMTLTTPVTYITRIPTDPFGPEELPLPYWSPDGGQPSWILWSAGPDAVYDLTGQNIQQVLDETGAISINAFLLQKTYDPTNGTDSSGDIWRSTAQW